MTSANFGKRKNTEMTFFLLECTWIETKMSSDEVKVNAAHLSSAKISVNRRRVSPKLWKTFFYHITEKLVRGYSFRVCMFLVFPKVSVAARLLNAKFLVSHREGYDKKFSKNFVKGLFGAS